MPEIAFFLRSGRLSNADLDFYVEACNLQIEQHFAPAWSLEPWPCTAYSDLPLQGAHPIAILDDVGDPGALGFHSDDLGSIYGRVMAQGADTASTMSHEACEMMADPSCDQWRPMGNGYDTCLEVCDAVEADSYPIDVTLFGQTRQVLVSNFLLASWFDPNGKAPFDYMGRLNAPFAMTPGGYMVVRDPNGNVSQVFAKNSTAAQRARHAAKFLDPMSRTYRRING